MINNKAIERLRIQERELTWTRRSNNEDDYQRSIMDNSRGMFTRVADDRKVDPFGDPERKDFAAASMAKARRVQMDVDDRLDPRGNPSYAPRPDHNLATPVRIVDDRSEDTTKWRLAIDSDAGIGDNGNYRIDFGMRYKMLSLKLLQHSGFSEEDFMPFADDNVNPNDVEGLNLTEATNLQYVWRGANGTYNYGNFYVNQASFATFTDFRNYWNTTIVPAMKARIQSVEPGSTLQPPVLSLSPDGRVRLTWVPAYKEQPFSLGVPARAFKDPDVQAWTPSQVACYLGQVVTTNFEMRNAAATSSELYNKVVGFDPTASTFTAVQPFDLRIEASGVDDLGVAQSTSATLQFPAQTYTPATARTLLETLGKKCVSNFAVLDYIAGNNVFFMGPNTPAGLTPLGYYDPVPNARIFFKLKKWKIVSVENQPISRSFLKDFLGAISSSVDAYLQVLFPAGNAPFVGQDYLLVVQPRPEGYQTMKYPVQLTQNNFPSNLPLAKEENVEMDCPSTPTGFLDAVSETQRGRRKRPTRCMEIQQDMINRVPRYDSSTTQAQSSVIELHHGVRQMFIKIAAFGSAGCSSTNIPCTFMLPKYTNNARNRYFNYTAEADFGQHINLPSSYDDIDSITIQYVDSLGNTFNPSTFPRNDFMIEIEVQKE